jgi:hypothetical protein
MHQTMEPEKENDNYSLLTKCVILLVVLAYVIPLFLLGENSYIRLHDTLEGEWVWLQILDNSHMAFNFHANAIVPQLMKGLPRNVYPTGLSVNMILVHCFGVFKAYIFSSLIIRIIGFSGMTLLLRTYFVKEHENRFIVWLCALAFSVLSVYTPFGISVLGQPLLLWAFLNLHNRTRLLTSYLIIALFPFYASIVWLAIPFTALLGLVGLYFFYHSAPGKHYVAGMMLLLGMFVVANFPMLSAMFVKTGFVSHRLAYNLYMFEKPDIGQSLGESLLMLVYTHYHIATFITSIAFMAIMLTIKKNDTLMMSIFIAIVLICLFQGFYCYPEYWFGARIALMKSFRFNRFSVLLPFLWLLGFALALAKMRRSAVLKPLVLPFLLLQILQALAGNDELIHNYRALTGHQKFPGFQNYVANQQFNEIKKYIGKPVDSFYVASLGISPSVAQFNGFYTLDGLMSVYDLHYKETFRNVFAGEITKSNDIAGYYDGWGNRCYIFSSELGIKHEAFNCYKFTPQHIDNFAFNAKAFSSMGGRFLISAVEIRNHDAQGLHLEKVFSDDQSWWTIYLYSVKTNS